LAFPEINLGSFKVGIGCFSPGSNVTDS
jgi:hypothetical protein